MDYINDFKLFSRDRGISSLTLDDYEKFNSQYIEPTIIEERKLNATQISVFSRLFMERILFIGTAIDSDTANIVNSQLLYLQTIGPNQNINLYINSPGGSVYDGMSIYDVSKFISCPISTTCCGMAASMGAVLLCAGDKGHRTALEHSKIMLHSPSGGTGRVTSHDFKIAAREMEKCEDMLYTVLSENMGQSYDYVKSICDRDYWLTPAEAVTEGVIDRVISKNAD